MSKTIKITDRTHTELDIFRATNKHKTFDDAILDLLKRHTNNKK